jgi:hypothetical protein
MRVQAAAKGCNRNTKKSPGPEPLYRLYMPGKRLFLFVPVSSEFFLPLMRRDFLFLSFFPAGHVGTPYL